MDDAQALADLKALDAQINGGNHYDAETYQKMLPHYQAYLEAREKLRALPLGDVKAAQVLPAGGVK
jgi:hypothetical protein